MENKSQQATADYPPELTNRMLSFFITAAFSLIIAFTLSLLRQHAFAMLLLMAAIALCGQGGIYYYILRADKWKKLEGECDGIEKRSALVRTFDSGYDVIIKEDGTGSLYLLRGRRSKVVYKEGTRVLAYVSKDSYDRNGLTVPSSIYLFRIIRR